MAIVEKFRRLRFYISFLTLHLLSPELIYLLFKIQGLCTYCSFCLELYNPRSLYGFFSRSQFSCISSEGPSLLTLVKAHPRHLSQPYHYNIIQLYSLQSLYNYLKLSFINYTLIIYILPHPVIKNVSRLPNLKSIFLTASQANPCKWF